MLHWLAILVAATALFGAALQQTPRYSDEGLRYTAIWVACSLIAATLLLALLEFWVTAGRQVLYRPLLAGIAGGAATVVTGLVLARVLKGSGECGRTAPAVGLLATGWSAVALTHLNAWGPLLGWSLIAGTLCGLTVVAAAAFIARAPGPSDPPFAPRLLLSLSLVLLVLSALASVG